jgi:WD40 repeat protein
MHRPKLEIFEIFEFHYGYDSKEGIRRTILFFMTTTCRYRAGLTYIPSAFADRSREIGGKFRLETVCELHTLAGHTDWVSAVAVTPDGRRAVSASKDPTLKVWDLETGCELHTLAGHNSGSGSWS